MKWCCDGFKYAHEQKHGRTIFVFVEPPSGEEKNPNFWIGMRCVEKESLGKIAEISLPDDLQITINTRLPIIYCPWCGRNLNKFYKNNFFTLLDRELLDEFSSL